MPLYQVARDFAGATREDLEAAGLRAKICAPWIPGVRWVESFYDPDREATTCIYEAERVDDLYTHSKFSGLPIGDVIEVEVVVAEDIGIDAVTPEYHDLAAQPGFADHLDGPVQPADPDVEGDRLFMTRRDISGLTEDEFAAGPIRTKLAQAWFPRVRWIESFLDRASETILCIYAASSAEEVLALAEAAVGAPTLEIREVEHVRPEDINAHDGEQLAGAAPPLVAEAAGVGGNDAAVPDQP